MSVEVRELPLDEKPRDFVDAGRVVFQDDPAWIAPLEMDFCDRLSPKKNPFFEHAELALFVAYRNGQVAGRCSAQVDRLHLQTHGDEAGFFGFFDTIEDQEVAQALLDRAAAWLRERGMKKMRGPYSLNIYEEAGALVEGFEHPPVLMTAHARSYQARLIEAAGFEGVKDLLAWHYKVEPPPPRAQRAWEQIQALPEVHFRSVDLKNIRRDIGIITEIFNDAWSDNWGHVPGTEAELDKTAKDMRLILDPDIAFFAEIDGRPVAMCVCVPNLNEALRGLKGKLFPFGIFKLLWRLKVKRVRSARLIGLGILRELRGVKRYGALSTAMYAELARRGIEKGYEWAELGWTLEDNRLINLGIQAMRGKVYKRYRVFEKAI